MVFPAVSVIIRKKFILARLRKANQGRTFFTP